MMQKLGVIIAVMWAGLLVSCAPAEWEMKVARQGEGTEMVWPPAPNPVKASLIGEVRGFTEIGNSWVSKLFGASEAGQIGKPVAVAVGDDGRIAVVDAERRAVHFFIPAEKKYRLIQRAGKDSLKGPVSVAFDDDLRLYVADSKMNRIFVYNRAGGFEEEIDGGGRVRFKRPTGLAYLRDNKLLYAVDTKDNTVHLFNKRLEYQGYFGGRGGKNGEFNLPTHIAAGFDGRIYVNDAMNFRVQVFSPPDNFVTAFGHHGNGSGDFAMPKGVAVDRWGVVYVAETLFDRLQLFNDKGDYLMSIGAKGTGPGEMWMPSGLYIDRFDKLYVCDTYNARIQIFQLYSREGR